MKRMKAQTVFLAVLLCTCLFSCSADVAGPHAAGDSVRVDPPSEEDAQFYDVGQTIQVKAIDKADPENVPLVSLTLDGCSVYEGLLPEGVDLTEMASYVVTESGIGDDGSIPDGLCFVKADISYANDNDYDVVIGVNSVRVGFFGLEHDETPPSYEMSWEDGIIVADAPHDAYMPVLPAHSTQSYSIGFIVPSHFVTDGNARLVAQSEIRGLEQGDVLGFEISKAVQHGA